MALFMKQDFTPPILSRKWLAMKCRPNMIINSRHHIISILESGLLFREDSIEVEQEAPSQEAVWAVAGGGKGGWLTKGEGVVSAIAVSACFIAFPPRTLQRSSLFQAGSYLSLPVAIRATHRMLCRGTLRTLLEYMRDYLALARRSAACLKEYAALYNQLGSLTSVIESTQTMLRRQQSEMCVLMSRASSALLGNAPWLRDDVAWDAVTRDDSDNLMKIHHAFLVVQSTLLKHIAMAHYVPSPMARKLYKNHNERIYWLHTVLIAHLIDEFKENYESLDRMYRLLKNCTAKDDNVGKKLGTAVIDNWLYTDVHSGVARATLELKLALNKCNTLDMFLDSCASNNQEIDLNVLNNDLDDLIDLITKCLSTTQSSQIRLKKLQGKVAVKETIDNNEVVVEEDVLKIEDKEPETKDEVFYLVRTDDDDEVQPVGDITTAPGKKERDATKIVLGELKRKLVKREDVMRERERQALAKTMPELKDIPEFPRQIPLEEYADKKGFITKIKKVSARKLFRNYKIGRSPRKIKKYRLKIKKYANESDIETPYYEANAKLNFKSILISFNINNKYIIINKWFKTQIGNKIVSDYSDLSDTEPSTLNGKVNIPKFTKKELELSTSSDSDSEIQKEQMALLKDIRRNRAVRKKNFPAKRPSIDRQDGADESMKPIEYSFGTGMAMASVLQVNNHARIPRMAQEEIFIGDGEVSNDSGNDEDA